jgi:hypothetical protein
VVCRKRAIILSKYFPHRLIDVDANNNIVRRLW